MFRWEESIWLLGLWGLIPLALLVFVGLYRNALLRKRIGSPAAVNRLLPGRIYWMPRLQASLALVVLGLLCVALANPQWGTRKGPVKVKSADAYILLDISQSMLSEDVPPNRLSRAQKAAMDIVDQLKGDRVGLIVFAGNAYLQMPLSTDYAAAKLFIQTATPSQAPTQGTDVGTAIETALQRFDPESARYRVLFLISDGEDHEAYTQEVIGRVVDEAIPIYTLGIGTEAGGFIPVQYQGRADYKRDESGNFIRTFFDPTFLRSVANSTGGAYYDLVNDPEWPSDMKKALEKLQRREVEQRSFTEFESYFPVFVGLALLLIALRLLLPERRRKKQDA